MALFAVTYDYDDRSDERNAIRPAHLKYLDGLVANGPLLAYGRYSDDGPPGAMFVYRAGAADEVEDLVGGDPYVSAGFVRGHRVRAWPARGTWPQSTGD